MAKKSRRIRALSLPGGIRLYLGQYVRRRSGTERERRETRVVTKITQGGPPFCPTPHKVETIVVDRKQIMVGTRQTFDATELLPWLDPYGREVLPFDLLVER